jgi:KaiC/GvpD/RAD55 family RecA-like ATPase
MAKPAEAFEKLPQNIEAERAILGAVLLDNKSLATAALKLTSGDFFHDSHKKIFHAMLALKDRDQAIDLVTLSEHMAKERQLSAIPGGAGYISALMDGRPNVSNVAHYADIVKEKSLLREAITEAGVIQASALDPGATAEDIYRRLRSSAEKNKLNGNGNGHGDLFKMKSYSLTEFLTTDFPDPDHLVEGVIPRDGTVLIVALPHTLKSWFTTALALLATKEGTILGKLLVNRAVRTLLVQVEDSPGQFKQRVRQLMSTSQFLGCDEKNIRFIPRCDLDLLNEEHFQRLLAEIKEFKPDLVILDVVRRIFSGDINSPKETRDFLERVDRLRGATHCTIALVHHENKKKEEIMLSSAGSYNLPTWGKVLIKFSRKVEKKTPTGDVTSVEIEIDNAYMTAPEPMRLVLDLSSTTPMRLEALEEGTGFDEAIDQLGDEWDVHALADVLGVHRSNAARRIKKWLEQGKIEKIRSGKRGRGRSLAMYRKIDILTDSIPDRRIN